MHNIEAAIKEYCSIILAEEPAWVRFLERKFPKISGVIDGSQSMRQECEDHLQDSYQSYIETGHNDADAWKLAQEHFGDTKFLSLEIRKIRRRSYKCLLVRFLAIIALLVLPLGKNARIPLPTFFHPQAVFLMTVCVVVGYMITRKRDSVSLRKYALYGAWLGLFWGIYRVIAVRNIPTQLGEGAAFMLFATFYGLFIATPGARRFVPAAMLILCQAGMSITLLRGWLIPLVSGGIDPRVLKMTVAACVVALLIGFLVFDIRKLHRRIAGMAAFGMVFAWIELLSNMSAPSSLCTFICATSLPPLIAVLMIYPIQKLQEFLLQEAG
jgi:hypothetical protein